MGTNSKLIEDYNQALTNGWYFNILTGDSVHAPDRGQWWCHVTTFATDVIRQDFYAIAPSNGKGRHVIRWHHSIYYDGWSDFEWVTPIGNSAFSDCISLTGITISKSVASIGSNVFDGCTALTKVFLEGGSTLTSESFGEVASKIATYWNEDNLTWTLTADGTMTISGSGAMKAYDTDDSPAT